MEQSCVVVDIGSAYCKAGWAGGNSPSIRVPSVVGYLFPPENPGPGPSSLLSEVLVGSNKLPIIKELPTEFIIHRGTITNWDAMEFMWHYIFSELSSIPNYHSLLVTGPPLRNKQCWRKITEVMMENFDVPSLHIGNQAELALFGSGLLTGMVLDCGAGLTHIVPILGGQVMSNSARISELGGLDISSLLHMSLINRDLDWNHFIMREGMEDLKEKLCYVSKNPYQKEYQMESFGDMTSMQGESSVLPDGTIVSLTKKHFTYPDALFEPSHFGLPGEELGDKIIRSALSCGWNFKSILSHVVLCGGSTLFEGFPERLYWELRRSRGGFWPSDVISLPNRIDLPWVGGSMLACLSTFKSYCITREKYRESGEAALQ